jgi:hypothetical protein
MEIFNVPLPEDIVQGAKDARGNFATKNASYRRAVCNHLGGLQWQSINGAGNCFFAAVSTCLLATLPPDRTDHLVGEKRLRALVVEWLEHQTQFVDDDLAERVCVEIDAELGVTLQCSKRGFTDHTPTTRAQYLKAVAVDGVWIQGYHWMRAVSTIAMVRVGLVIYSFDSVCYFGHGDKTIYLYKVWSFLSADHSSHSPSRLMQRRILKLWSPNHCSVRDVHQLCFHAFMMTCFAAAVPGSAQRA